MLSLRGFGGTHVNIHETQFAVKVNAFNMAHPVLLGLPAMMAARVHLLTVKGRYVMPDMNKSLTLSFQPSWLQAKAAQTLNCLANLMMNEPDEMEKTLAWETLGLGEFGP